VPRPPFLGSRVVNGVPLADYASYLDERATFMGQWGLRGGRGGKGPSYDELVETEGRPRLRMWLDRVQSEQIMNASVAYGYFPCVSKGDDLIVLTEDGNERCRFRRVSEVTAEMFARNAYREYLELHGLSVQLTEALAEYWHARVRAELGFAAEDSGDLSAVLSKQAYRGSRYSFGYPACPNLEDQAMIMDLLQPGRIGVELSEEWQLHPEQSTSAIIVHHPEAKYFAAR
jgi:5-methyltetrahydrofolate--homocysteine methyltransferase